MSPVSKGRTPKPRSGKPGALSPAVAQRVDAMARRYQSHIDRQAEALGRLAKMAVAVETIKTLPARPMTEPGDMKPEERQTYRRGYADAIKQVQEFIKSIVEDQT